MMILTQCKRGLTLIELIVVAAILATVVVTLSPMILFTSKSTTQVQNSANFSQESMSIFAYLAPRLDNGVTILVAELTTLEFQSNDTTYTITISGAAPYTLNFKESDSPVEQLSRDIQSITFRYFDQHRIETTQFASIGLIEIDITFSDGTHLYRYQNTLSVRPEITYLK